MRALISFLSSFSDEFLTLYYLSLTFLMWFVMCAHFTLSNYFYAVFSFFLIIICAKSFINHLIKITRGING